MGREIGLLFESRFCPKYFWDKDYFVGEAIDFVCRVYLCISSGAWRLIKLAVVN